MREMEAPVEPPAPPRRRSSTGRVERMPLPEPARKSRGGFFLMVLLALGLGGGAWWFTHRQGAEGAGAPDSTASRPAPPRGRSPAAATPRPSAPTSSPSTPSPAPPVNPPVLIGGLTLESVTGLPDGGVRVVHRNDARDLIEMLVRPLGDTVGEPDPGQVRVDSVPTGNNTAIMNFDGYLIFVRARLAPAELRALTGRIYAVPR